MKPMDEMDWELVSVIFITIAIILLLFLTM